MTITIQKQFFSVFLIATLPLFSCSSSSEEDCNLSDNLCSCDVRSTALESCADYEGRTVENAQSDCTTDAGSLAQGSACPTSGRVGTCKITVLGKVKYNRYYSDAATHQTSCTISALGTGFLGAVDWIDD